MNPTYHIISLSVQIMSDLFQLSPKIKRNRLRIKKPHLPSLLYSSLVQSILTFSTILQFSVEYTYLLYYTLVQCRVHLPSLLYYSLVQSTLTFSTILQYSVEYTYLLYYTLVQCKVHLPSLLYSSLVQSTLIFSTILQFSVEYTYLLYYILQFSVEYTNLLYYTLVQYRYSIFVKTTIVYINPCSHSHIAYLQLNSRTHTIIFFTILQEMVNGNYVSPPPPIKQILNLIFLPSCIPSILVISELSCFA